MFHFELYDDTRLQNFKHRKKVNVVKEAVKLYRQDNPLNTTKVLLFVIVICFIPPVVFYFLFGISLFVSWSCISILLLNIKAASAETPRIKPYLDRVIGEIT